MQRIFILATAAFVILLQCASSSQGMAAQAGAETPPLPDYTSPSATLSTKEKRAVRLAREWDRAGSGPIQSGSKTTFVHGASIPTIVGAPLQVSDIELQPGEQVNEVIVGDSARWLLETARSGQDITHIMLKPVDAGLETNAIITTDRRVYHLKLKSVRSGHMPHVGFLYQEEHNARLKIAREREEKEKQWKSAEVDGKTVDLSTLDFAYEMKGDASWKPLQVFDDGRQMFIRLPKAGETPVLLARNGGQDMLVNYRMRDLTIIVDGLFPECVLIAGVGGKQERVSIKKKMK